MRNRRACEALIYMVLVVFCVADPCAWVRTSCSLSQTNSSRVIFSLLPLSTLMLSPPHDLDYAHTHTHMHMHRERQMSYTCSLRRPHMHIRAKKLCLSRAACVYCHVQPVLIYLRCLSHKDYFFFHFPTCFLMLNCTLRLQLTLHDCASPVKMHASLFALS